MSAIDLEACEVFSIPGKMKQISTCPSCNFARWAGSFYQFRVEWLIISVSTTLEHKCSENWYVGYRYREALYSSMCKFAQRRLPMPERGINLFSLRL